MSKEYNVDDILKEIKSKKVKQNTASPFPSREKSAFPTDKKPLPPSKSSVASKAPAEPKPKQKPSSHPEIFQKQPAASKADQSNEVFFSCLSTHRENVKIQHEEERNAKLEAEKLLAQQKAAEQAASDVPPVCDKEAAPESKEENDLLGDLSSFLLEQQPADLPPVEGNTPFGDFEPTTPSAEQEASSLEGKSEYQKYFSKARSRRKQALAEEMSDKAEDATALFDASSFESEEAPAKKEPEKQPEKQSKPEDDSLFSDDLFANMPTGLTDEFPAIQIDSDVANKTAENAEEQPEEQKPKEKKARHLFGKKPKEEEEEPASRLASAEIPVPEDFDNENTDAELDDYSSPKDKESVLHDIQGIKTGLLVRIVIMVVLFGLSLYLALAARDIRIGNELLPLPTFVQPELHLRSYMITSCVISAIGALVCANTVGGGLIALLKLRANTDSLPMLAVLGTLAQGICYIVRPEFFSTDKASFNSNLYLFFPVALFILLFNLIGKLFVILRIQNNFRVVSSEHPKHAAVFLKDRTLLRELSRGLSMEEYTIAYPESSKLLSGFLDNSYSEDHAENMSRVLAPICLLAGIFMAVLSYLFNKNAADAVSTFTAIMCVSAPLTSTIAANFPLLRISNKLTPAGAMVSGYSAVENFALTEAVVLDAKDLFKPSDIVLHGIKPFDQGQIDSVILDAASVVCNTDGMLTEVFSKIIGSDKSLLKPVENVTYEDSMGLSAWVDGKRVLIGNRELMINHGIEVPSNDYEMRFVKDSKNIIYLANSGQLSAMFVISYQPNKASKNQLDKLAAKGMYLMIHASDPNITAEKIHAAYDFPLELIRLIPAKFQDSYEQLTAERDASPAKIGFLGSARNMVTAILDCMDVKTAIDQAVLIQMIAIVVGYGLVSLFSLMGNLSYLSIGHLILFQVIWALIGTIVPNLKKNA